MRSDLSNSTQSRRLEPEILVRRIRELGSELGFQQIGIAGVDLSIAEHRLTEWLQKRFHGCMDYMARHGERRSRPAQLLPGTISVISARMDYLPQEATDPRDLLDHSNKAYVSRYALGRDYHKTIRRRLARLTDHISDIAGEFGHRAFVDSAPVLEKPLAENAGLGWIGKHTNLINKQAGSWFFLGEIYTDLPLPADMPATAHCGTCKACIDICPTNAIVAPYQLDARRCISYLTIELRGAIPLEFRKSIGNRIYGCDDCQLFCPWNKFARFTTESDFQPRHGLDDLGLTDAFGWDQALWELKTAGSAIRRIGYECWLRNVAVALGNAATTPQVVAALQARRQHPSALVREHVAWALAQHGAP